MSPDDRWKVLDAERASIEACAELQRACMGSAATPAYDEARQLADTKTLELARCLIHKQLEEDAYQLEILTAKIADDDLRPDDDWLDRRVQHGDVIAKLESLIWRNPMGVVTHALRNARVELDLPYNPSEERY